MRPVDLPPFWKAENEKDWLDLVSRETGVPLDAVKDLWRLAAEVTMSVADAFRDPAEQEDYCYGCHRWEDCRKKNLQPSDGCGPWYGDCAALRLESRVEAAVLAGLLSAWKGGAS